MITDVLDGGLNVVDLDCFFSSLKAAWVPRILSIEGKWSDLFKASLKQLGFTPNYIFKTNFTNVEYFPIIKCIPPFYQEVIVSFNKCKKITPLKDLNKSDVFQQPLWGNEYFKMSKDYLYLKNWVKEGINYVKDLVNPDGSLKNDEQLYESIRNKHDVYNEMFLLKNHVLKKIKHIDSKIAPFIKIKPFIKLLFKNKLFTITNQKSKFFYNILKEKVKARGNMETIYSREFKFENVKSIWKNVYSQKVKWMKIIKISEFNFKLLHNIVPCGKVISKWQQDISSRCEICKEIETVQHMLYNCNRVKQIWYAIADVLKIDIKWKNIVCGFPKYEQCTATLSTINYILSIVAYSIFKENSHTKFEEKAYYMVNLANKIKTNLISFKLILHHAFCKNVEISLFEKVINVL